MFTRTFGNSATSQRHASSQFVRISLVFTCVYGLRATITIAGWQIYRTRGHAAKDAQEERIRNPKWNGPYTKAKRFIFRTERRIKVNGGG